MPPRPETCQIIVSNMTAARRSRNKSLGPVLSGGVLALVLSLAITSLVAAATTERIVVDPRTGLAIHGFDPVAYFTEKTPATGQAELELPHGGAVWRFRNAGNRAAFAAHPDVYMPQFGGYDPIVLARGVTMPGHPALWLIVGDRLYMFNTQEARDAFAADPAVATDMAQASWRTLRPNLVP
jgi:hypothetical protein